jgi:hypothetical protein
MNLFFGGMLRDELIKLMKPILLRKRAASTGSRRISSDSAEQVGEMDAPPIPCDAKGVSRFLAALQSIRLLRSNTK